MPDSPAITLTTPLTKVKGIGAKTAQDLKTLGLTNVGRLIAHLPLRHEFQAAETSINQLVAGQVVTARGEITATRQSATGKRPRFEAVLVDETGRVDLTWFNMPFIKERVKPGMRFRVRGKLARYGPALQIVNPHLEALDAEKELAVRDERLRPVYPANEFVSSLRIERAMQAVLDQALSLLEDHLSEEYRRGREMPSLAEAYRMQHRPVTEEEVKASRRRLAYDEFLLLQLGVHMKRAHLRRTLRAPVLRHTPQIDAHIRARFPFTLTPGQEEAVADIVRDLTSGTPTNRLIQGDVGSGKTLVALYAMLLAVAGKHQALLMAPTEILAEQHFASISRILGGSTVRVALLTGATPMAERKETLAALESASLDIIIGTHSLLSEHVVFKNLAVAVIDEQHRFGVSQRAVLRERGTGAPSACDTTTPHVLVMTATPIPRSLGLTLFGDLDISTIRGLPPGRRPIRTVLAAHQARDEVYAKVRKRLEKGEQAYVIAPAIEGGESGTLQGVTALAEELEQRQFVGLRVGLMHGQLPHAQRESVMDDFRNGHIDVLVATTVIEVGVDVANATVMIVEQADRFGLAQLHQLRGRVGRGEIESVCYLISTPVTDIAFERLRVMETVSDGFALAEKDLELRGPGEVFGTKQSGLPPFRVANLVTDLDLLRLAQRDAAEWIAASPLLGGSAEVLLLRRVRKTHGESLGLADVG
jgi:ATP-dependent DNA helicase RecG